MDKSGNFRYTKHMKSIDKTTQNQDQEALRRFEEAMVDADIESLARSPEIEAELAGWRADGISLDQQIERLKRRFSGTESSDPNAK